MASGSRLSKRAQLGVSAVEARGARIREFAWTCGKSHIAGRKRTSLQGTDTPDFFSSPTGAHIAPFYLAIGRSVVCTPPVLRCPSLNCDQTKIWRSAQAAVFVQTHCSPDADSLAALACVMFTKSTEARA
jgi:hypothetical protein